MMEYWTLDLNEKEAGVLLGMFEIAAQHATKNGVFRDLIDKMATLLPHEDREKFTERMWNNA
jgi:hypothetical protein